MSFPVIREGRRKDFLYQRGGEKSFPDIRELVKLNQYDPRVNEDGLSPMNSSKHPQMKPELTLMGRSEARGLISTIARHRYLT